MQCVHPSESALLIMSPSCCPAKVNVLLRLQGIAGTVVRNATGNLWQQQLPLNLTAQAKAGWNKITLQGKAVDPATSGVQTCECQPQTSATGQAICLKAAIFVTSLIAMQAP